MVYQKPQSNILNGNSPLGMKNKFDKIRTTSPLLQSTCAKKANMSPGEEEERDKSYRKQYCISSQFIHDVINSKSKFPAAYEDFILLFFVFKFFLLSHSVN